jgi:DNA-binding NarL/FixJ family response regulator
MTGGNGFEFLERVQGCSAIPHVAVLTNYFNDQYRKRCLALGAVAFLDKSSQFGELESLIATLRRTPRGLRQ